MTNDGIEIAPRRLSDLCSEFKGIVSAIGAGAALIISGTDLGDVDLSWFDCYLEDERAREAAELPVPNALQSAEEEVRVPS